MNRPILILTCIAVLSGCAKKSEEASMATSPSADRTEEQKAPSTSTYSSSDKLFDSNLSLSATAAGNGNPEKYISSAALSIYPSDTNRKLILTADLKFKVKSVIKATYQIEDIVLREGGFVTVSNLTSDVDYTKNTNISADSSLTFRYFTTSNYLTLRVPYTKLDSTLKQIAKLIDYLDYRNLSAEDVGLQLRANQWRQNRYGRNERRLSTAIDDKNAKLKDLIAAEEQVLNSQEQQDQALMSSLQLQDQIQYSTIKLTIYQNQSVFRELVANEENIKAYEPSFGARLLDAIAVGWYLLQELILILFKLWWFFALGIGLYVGIKQLRLYRNRLKK